MGEKPGFRDIELVLSSIYIDGLDQLVEKGLSIDRQDAIRYALRHIFIYHKIEPFYHARAR